MPKWEAYIFCLDGCSKSNGRETALLALTEHGAFGSLGVDCQAPRRLRFFVSSQELSSLSLLKLVESLCRQLTTQAHSAGSVCLGKLQKQVHTAL